MYNSQSLAGRGPLPGGMYRVLGWQGSGYAGLWVSGRV